MLTAILKIYIFRHTMSAEKTSTVESLLGLLSLGPMSGYEMRQMMERSTANFWTESYGQIYPALKRMVKDGLATVEEQSKDGRTKKVYKLTGEGGGGCGRGWGWRPGRRCAGMSCC